jgi:hypothetical protein
MAEIVLGISSRNDSGNVKITNGRFNFVLDKGDGKAFLNISI